MVQQDEAEKAFEAARALIEQAKREGRAEISFDSDGFRALTRIPDAVAGLAKVTFLNLDKTRITDLTPICGLTGLRELYIGQTGVIDLSPIRALAGLQRLSLDKTGVTDLSPIRGLTGLRELFLDQTGVTDLTPIRGLTGLQRLWLTQTLVTDLTPIHGLTGLRELFLDQTGITDLRPLIGLGTLGAGVFEGLWFDDTPAVRLDETLARLAQIRDHEQRAKEILAYLRTLRPWPEPLR